VGDVVVFKAAQDVGDGVAFADVGKELVTEAFALRRAFHEARDIDEGHPRGDDLFGACDFGQDIKTRVRHADIADVGFDRAKREVRGLCGGGLGQCVEQC